LTINTNITKAYRLYNYFIFIKFSLSNIYSKHVLLNLKRNTAEVDVQTELQLQFNTIYVRVQVRMN